MGGRERKEIENEGEMRENKKGIENERVNKKERKYEQDNERGRGQKEWREGRIEDHGCCNFTFMTPCF